MHPNRLLTILLFIATTLLLAAAGDQPPNPASSEIQADLSTALSHRLQAVSSTQSLTLDLFTPELDTAFITPDGKTAVLWMALRDDYGKIVATEPGLALARLSNEGWQVLLRGDPGWDDTLTALPDGMLPLEQLPAPADVGTTSASTQALTGYYLPWAAGTARQLEGSIGHYLIYYSCANNYECLYAYDFAGPFAILASKDGTVVSSRDGCSDGNPNCTNYIVLRDISGSTYQIYIHLAYGTIPNNLANGTTVRRGQYLGDTDDTGYSTNNHLHFMVTNNLYLGNGGYYWGTSIDIRFAEVPINNGIPRTCYEVTHFQAVNGATQCMGDKSDSTNPANDWYVSGNVDPYLPTGTLNRPAAGATVNGLTNPLIDVTAYAEDDVHVEAVRLIAKINNQWVEVGPKITQPASTGMYDWDADLCEAGPLNGPLEVALRVWDHEGNVAAVLDPRTIQVDHACPPPTSQLNPAEAFDSTAVRLSWDAFSNGAGLGSFELQWRTDPGTWDPANTLATAGDQRSTWFAGQPGQTYGFRLRAFDINGQPEPWPDNEAAETNATLPTTCNLVSEPDDDLSQARQLTLGEWATGNLCPLGDTDWFQVEIYQAGSYYVSAPSQSGGAAVDITIYTDNDLTMIGSGKAAGVGQAGGVRFRADAGKLYIKVEPLVPNLIGTNATYGLVIFESKEIFLPLLVR